MFPVYVGIFNYKYVIPELRFFLLINLSEFKLLMLGVPSLFNTKGIIQKR